MANRWRRFAILARYGHQDITTMLGRPLRELELQLFTHAIEELIEHDFAKAPTAAGDL